MTSDIGEPVQSPEREGPPISMKAIDKLILNILQTAFPLEAAPYQAIAHRTGLTEEEVIARVRALQDSGIIRRIGAVFDLRKVGYVSTLCAARVPPEGIDPFVGVVNGLPGVTHNYRRDHPYNIWFTLIVPSQDALRLSLEEIRRRTGILDILSLSATRTFKINATFEL